MFEIQVDGGLVKLAGRLDAAQADRAKATLDMVKQSATLDLTDLDYVSSAGLGVIVLTFKRLRDAGLGFRLTNMKPRIRSVFLYAGLNQVFPLE
jgi:anti-sigma B factor antagonist